VKTRARLALACLLACVSAASTTRAQNAPIGRVVRPRRPVPVRVTPAPAATNDDNRDLRARFGALRAERLACSPDADDQLRGIERAAASSSAEAIQWLAQLARDPGHACGGAPETGGATAAELRVALARGLAMHSDDATARAALVALLDPPPNTAGDDHTREPEAIARLEMARRIAALALAQAADATKVEKLLQLARDGGTASAAATAALVAFPPTGTSSWVRSPSPHSIRLAAQLGERRAAGMLLETARGHDVESRAAAIEALGSLGDARVIALALDVKSEDDARLRLAAAYALVQLGAPEAARAVEALLSEDSMVARALPLAETAHGPGVVRALAARAASAVDPAVRSEAIVGLGRDPGPEGVEALEALAVDSRMRAEAMDALARSPSGNAMPSLEKLAAVPALRRDAVRAYVVRALVRGETSDGMNRTLDALASAADARDRAVGVFGRAALGRGDAAAAMDDRDPAVRRAAYAAALGRGGADVRVGLLARRAREEDPAARAVLGGALGGPLDQRDPEGVLSTRDLLSCARAGGADAPLCALAFARRAGEAEAPETDALLASRDPILRAHVARGLGLSADPTRAGRLAAAYAREIDPLVRRAIVRGLGSSREVPSAATILTLASRCDPDARARWIAGHVLHGAPVEDAASDDVAWVRLVDATGEPGGAGLTGALWSDDGAAVPIAFDADGDALVVVPAGTARLLLAPPLPAAYVGAR
jgi:HEAT repeat protein